MQLKHTFLLLLLGFHHGFNIEVVFQLAHRLHHVARLLFVDELVEIIQVAAVRGACPRMAVNLAAASGAHVAHFFAHLQAVGRARTNTVKPNAFDNLFDFHAKPFLFACASRSCRRALRFTARFVLPRASSFASHAPFRLRRALASHAFRLPSLSTSTKRAHRLKANTLFIRAYR